MNYLRYVNDSITVYTKLSLEKNQNEDGIILKMMPVI